jgi:hypothetical protein
MIWIESSENKKNGILCIRWIPFFFCGFVTIHHAEPEAAMERVSVARMATAKLQGWIYAARGMGVSGSVSTELNRYE